MRLCVFIYLFTISLPSHAQQVDTVTASIHLQNGLTALQQANFQKAITLTQQALSNFQKTLNHDHFRIADCYNQLGRCAMRTDNFVQAIDYFQKARTIRQTNYGKTHHSVSACYNNLGNVYLQIGDFAQAEQYHQQALEIRYRYKSERPLDLAKSYSNLGSTFYYQQDFEQAYQYYVTALQIRQQILDVNHIAIAKTEMNIGNCFLAVGSYQEALPYYESVLKKFQNNYETAHPDIADAYFNLANVHFGQYDYNKALEFYQNALNIQQEIYGHQHLKVATTYQNMGHCFDKQGNPAQAILYFDYAKNIRQLKLPELHPDLADSYEAIGLSELSKGNMEAALQAQRKTAKIRQVHFAADTPLLTGTWTNIGNIFLAQQQIDSAQFYFQKALNLVEKYPVQRAQLLNNLGICLLVKEDKTSLKSALKYFEQAIELNQQLQKKQANYWKNKAVAHSKLKAYEAAEVAIATALEQSSFEQKQEINFSIASSETIDILAFRGSLATQQFEYNRDKYLLQKAVADYEFCLQLLQRLQRQLTIAQSKQQLLQNHYYIFADLIAVYYQLYQLEQNPLYLEKAFQTAEQSKSQLLLANFQDLHAQKIAGIPDSLLQKEQDLKTTIAYTNDERRAYQELGDLENTQYLTEQILQLHDEHQALIRLFETQFPDYYQLKYAPSKVNITDIQENFLLENQSIIEYFIGNKQIYLFIITKDSFDVMTIEKSTQLNELVAQLRLSLYQYPSAGSQRAANLNNQFLEAAHQLFQQLIPQIPLPEQLIIIPDAALNFIPFELLLTSLPKRPFRFKSHAYLIYQHQISYAFSVKYLATLKERTKNNLSYNLVGFAPHFDENHPTLSPLKFNHLELHNIQKIITGKTFFDSTATLSNFKEFASSAEILHLATHGSANSQDPNESFLAFYSSKDSSAHHLFINELYHQPIHADLVVLSACETGLGDFQYGEGVVSLARAFSYAGAKSVLTSLWGVHDKSTAELITLFYQYLAQGLTKDAALQQAKIEFIQQRPHDEAHPFYWAGFVGIGDMGKLTTKKPLFSWYKLSIGTFLLLIISLLLYNWHKNNGSLLFNSDKPSRID